MIAIFGAMEEEIQQFLTVMTDMTREEWLESPRYLGRIDGHRVLVSKSGVGKVMAAMTTQYLIDHHKPRALIFTGLAGSLRPHIAIGDTLLGRDLVQHDMDATSFGFARGEVPFTKRRFIAADPGLLALASSFKPAEGRVHLGRICTGDCFVDHVTAPRSPWLTTDLEGDAAEMEGAAVAMVCDFNRLPCLVARTISDKADDSAHADFDTFLPRASHNSLELVRHILGGMS